LSQPGERLCDAEEEVVLAATEGEHDVRTASGEIVHTSEHGLKADAISFWDGLVVALASTAPAYSLAAVIGSMAVIVGFFAPAALLLAFVPMFFIAAAFYWLNKADQDCGTTFAWVTRAMGPNTGWIAGWAVCMTGILVIGSLADVATYTFYDLIEADGLYDSEAAVTIGAVLLIIAMTTVCVIGTEASANLQKVLIGLQIIPLLLFTVVVLVKVWGGDGPGTAFEPQLAWFNPFNIDAGNINPFSAEAGDLVGAMLLADHLRRRRHRDSRLEGPRRRRSLRRRRGHPLRLRARGARGRPGQAGAAGDRRLGTGLDPDDDPARRQNLPLDGSARGDPGALR
jgi:hypothetical protein